MRTELKQRLYDEFPDLYRRRTEPRSSMRYSPECDDGWFDIVHALSARIQALLVDARQQQPELDHPPGGDVVAFAQIKEKLGGLRVYMAGRRVVDGVAEAIADAERRADETCERCGGPGELRQGGGWLRVLCDGCRERGEAARAQTRRVRRRRDSAVDLFLEERARADSNGGYAEMCWTSEKCNQVLRAEGSRQKDILHFDNTIWAHSMLF
ncbi:hypothetical protein F4778DRAFT_778460 [Xylariomycetidae sp. FL2044]|nr:hypothetical protein F4778DRAFT_778460 [Xylariomycetidae sp. FL2044]